MENCSSPIQNLKDNVLGWINELDDYFGAKVIHDTEANTDVILEDLHSIVKTIDYYNLLTKCKDRIPYYITNISGELKHYEIPKGEIPCGIQFNFIMECSGLGTLTVISNDTCYSCLGLAIDLRYTRFDTKDIIHEIIRYISRTIPNVEGISYNR